MTTETRKGQFFAAAVIAFALGLGGPAGSRGPLAAESDCRTQQLADAQRQILQMLRPTEGVDLTTIRDDADRAALAALGYNFYPHQQVSIEGMGWPVLDTLVPHEPGGTRPAPGRPTLLLYEPTVPEPPLTVTEPRDGYDYPYRLAGWMYGFLYDFDQHPVTGGDGQPFLTCLARDEWFVHERGIHDFATGGFIPRPPDEEVRGEAPHGTTRGSDTSSMLPELQPGDVPHERFWDLHVWLDGDDVPTVSMLNPGQSIPGIDPGVGVSPPPDWPNTAQEDIPAFYYPPASGGAVRVEETGECEVVQPVFALPPENIRPLVPTPFDPAVDPATGKVTVAINVVHCERVTVYGNTQETTFAHLVVGMVDPEDPPGGEDPADVINNELFNHYDVWFISDNPDLVRFWREQAGHSDSEAVYIEGLVFDGDPAPERFTFVAPAPAPSPFTVEAVVGEPRPLGIDITGNFWSAVHRGTDSGPIVKIPDEIRGVRFGSAEGKVTAERDSDLHRIFCDDSDGSWADPTTHLLISSGAYFADVQENTETSPVGAPTCATPTRAPTPAPGKATGGGQIDGDPVFSPAGDLLSLPAIMPSASGGGRANFGFVITDSSAPAGNLNYHDHDTGDVIKATWFDSLTISGNHARFTGTATFKGAAGYRLEADVDDLGEPGSSDTFSITVSDPLTGLPVYMNSGTLIGGNIKIHR